MTLILIIDDERDFLTLLRRWLERAGYEVIEAANGGDGLELVRTRQPDLVVTDLIMPDMEGLELIRSMRREKVETPVIAMSGGGRCDPGDYLKTAQAFGVQRTFSKPFDREPFLAAIAELTG